MFMGSGRIRPQRAAWPKGRRGLGMTCLSIVTEDRPATVAANPIFILSQVDDRRGAEIAFEIFEKDAGILKTLIGKKRLYYINLPVRDQNRYSARPRWPAPSRETPHPELGCWAGHASAKSDRPGRALGMHLADGRSVFAQPPISPVASATDRRPSAISINTRRRL